MAPPLTSTPTQDVVDERAMRAWVAFLRAHAGITRQLDADLIAAHGLTLNDYDVLVQLRDEPLRMSELADRIVLTRSGVTRRVDRLERAGLVRRRACASDARGSWAELTPAGQDTLADARATHLHGVQELFAGRLGGDQLELLADLLSDLPLGPEAACDA